MEAPRDFGSRYFKKLANVAIGVIGGLVAVAMTVNLFRKG